VCLLAGLQEAEVNEFMLVFLGLGIASFVAMALIIYCRRYRSFNRKPVCGTL
jgi:hypothetical protein